MAENAATIDDYGTIQAVLSGDHEAYAVLVRAYHARVRSLCLSVLLDVTEADDAAQDVFVKAFNALSAYRRDSSFLAWLSRIASNHCLDILRKRKRQKTDSLDRLMTDSENDQPMGFQPRMAEPSESDHERNDKLAMAMEVLAGLSPEQREVLVLREVDGMRYEEISATLRCSLDTVKTRLYRARRQLQEKARHFLDRQTYIR